MPSKELSRNRISIKELFLSDVGYSAWANLRLLDAFAELIAGEPERDLKIPLSNILTTLQHICDGEKVWLECLSTTNAGGKWILPMGPAPKLTLTELREKWPELWEGYEQWLRGLSDADVELKAEIFVQLPDGRAPRYERWQILRHALDHSQFHRGQVIGMIRSLGRTPPAINRNDYWLAGHP